MTAFGRQLATICFFSAWGWYLLASGLEENGFFGSAAHYRYIGDMQLRGAIDALRE